ncbi:hypothetical protein L7F22_014793 [Adiantum nelumboides]|nr:hypothetical protein [Adiantum nelumboides]
MKQLLSSVQNMPEAGQESVALNEENADVHLSRQRDGQILESSEAEPLSGTRVGGTNVLQKKLGLKIHSRHAANLLEQMMRKHLVPVESLPYHEMICFRSVATMKEVNCYAFLFVMLLILSPLRVWTNRQRAKSHYEIVRGSSCDRFNSKMQPAGEDFQEHLCLKWKICWYAQKQVLVGEPRRVIQQNVKHPLKVINCECCCLNNVAISSSMNDNTILLHLAQKQGDQANLFDLYQSFSALIGSLTSEKKANNKKGHHKSIDEQEVDKALVQARFCKAAAELQLVGLFRNSGKKRSDFVQLVV